MGDVVVTGMGLCCNLGDSVTGVAEYLRQGVSEPFYRWPDAVEHSGRCQLIGICDTDVSDEELGVDRGLSRFMGRSSRLALKAARKAVAQAGCRPEDMAIIVGGGTGDVATHVEIHNSLLRKKDLRRISPAVIPKIMASTVSANLTAAFKAQGPSCGISAACAGGAWNIAVAKMLINSGAAKCVVAGGVEVADLHFHAGFDSMRAYNSTDNERPDIASRPYAADRQGFIFAEGAGILVLEDLASAEARNAEILGVLAGCGMSSDGTGSMVQPSWEGGLRAMQAAVASAGVHTSEIEYVNTHGTSTPVGDIEEVRGIRELLGGRHVPYSSTKGYTGHTISGAGAIEAIFCLNMMQNHYIAPCINISELDPELADFPPVLVPTSQEFTLCMSNSFGFGGTNVSLVLAAQKE